MGSQISKQPESNQTNSFTQKFDETVLSDNLDSEERSNESSLGSYMNVNDNAPEDQNIVNYTFKWNSGGYDASIVGGFND